MAVVKRLGVASTCFPYWSCCVTASFASDVSVSGVSNDVHIVPTLLDRDMSAVLRLVALVAFPDTALMVARIAVAASWDRAPGKEIIPTS